MIFKNSPPPPYYAVIFTSTLTNEDNQDYPEMADKMVKLAEQQPGFLGVESAREVIGITVSYWSSLSAIKSWKKNAEHSEARRLGKEQWYASFKVRIAKVEKEYGI